MCSGLVKDEMTQALWAYMDSDALKAWDPKGLILTTNTTWGEVPGSKPIYDYMESGPGGEAEEPDWAKV